MDKLSASKRKSPRRSSPKRSSPKRSSPRRHTGKLHDPVPMTPMHLSTIWILVAISFLTVCIVVFGGKYHGLATRDFNDVDVDGRLRMGNIERKTIVGYTPVFNVLTSGAAAATSYLYNTKTALSAVIPVVVGVTTVPPANVLQVPRGWTVASNWVVADTVTAQGGATTIQFTQNDQIGGGAIQNLTTAIATTGRFNSVNEAERTQGYNGGTNQLPWVAADQGIYYTLAVSTLTAGQLKVVLMLERYVS